MQELFEGCIHVIDEEIPPEQLQSLPNEKGIVCFADVHDRPIQLLTCGSIRRTCASRLSEDSEKQTKRADVSAITERIYFRQTFNDITTRLDYCHLAGQLFGPEADDIIRIQPCWVVRLDFEKTIPTFTTGRGPQCGNNEKVFGLFPTSRSASDFVESFQILFDLCRCPERIARGQTKSCPYYQMKQCPSPCLIAEEIPSYKIRLEKAARTAASMEFEDIRTDLETKMKSWASQMEYERAQAAKKKLKIIEKLKSERYQWVGNLSELCILHIDRSFRKPLTYPRRNQQLYSVYLVTANNVYHLACCLPEAVEELKPCIVSQAQNLIPVDLKRITKRESDYLSLVSSLLFRSSPPGVWLRVRGKLLTTYRIEEGFNQAFG